MGKPRKPRWKLVTNDFVMTFAAPDCRNCGGKGAIGDGKVGNTTMCSCATLAFRREYAGRVRRIVQRIGNKDVARIEYTDMVVVTEAHEEAAAEAG